MLGKQRSKKERNNHLPDLHIVYVYPHYFSGCTSTMYMTQRKRSLTVAEPNSSQVNIFFFTIFVLYNK